MAGAGNLCFVRLMLKCGTLIFWKGCKFWIPENYLVGVISRGLFNASRSSAGIWNLKFVWQLQGMPNGTTSDSQVVLLLNCCPRQLRSVTGLFAHHLFHGAYHVQPMGQDLTDIRKQANGIGGGAHDQR